MDHSRQKIQDSILKHYRIRVDCDQKAKTAPIDFRFIAEELKKGGLSEIEIYTERDYLEEMGFFVRYATWSIRATGRGIDKIWGATSHSPYHNLSNQNDEIIKLAPEVWGIGVNLKALWEKIKKLRKYRGD